MRRNFGTSRRSLRRSGMSIMNMCWVWLFVRFHTDSFSGSVFLQMIASAIHFCKQTNKEAEHLQFAAPHFLQVARLLRPVSRVVWLALFGSYHGGHGRKKKRPVQHNRAPPPPRHTVWPGLDSDHEIELTRSNCPAVLCRRRFTEHNCNWGAKHPTDMKQLMVYFTWSVTICGSFRTRTLSAWVHCFRCPQFANFNFFPVLHVVYDASYNLLDVFVHLFDRFAGINRLAKRWLQERFVERTLCTLWCDGLQKYDMFELVTQLTFQSCSSNSL